MFGPVAAAGTHNALTVGEPRSRWIWGATMTGSGTTEAVNGELPHSTPSIPAHHLWLTDGVYSTFYFTPGATDSVLLAGPSVGRTFDPQSDLG